MRRFVLYDAYFFSIRPFGILFDNLFGKYGAFSGALLSIVAAVAAWIGVQRQIDEQKYNNLVAERALINSEIERVEKQFVGMLSTNRIYDRLRKVKPLISSNRSQGYAFPILSAFSETKSKYEKARLAFITNGDEDYAKIHSNLSNFNSTIFLSYLQDIVLETNTCGSECKKIGSYRSQI